MQQVRFSINWQTGRHSVIRLKVVNSPTLKLSWHDYCQQLSSSNLCFSCSDASNRGWLRGGWRQEEVDVRVLHLQQLAQQRQVHDVSGQQAGVRDREHLQRGEQQQPERWALSVAARQENDCLLIPISPSALRHDFDQINLWLELYHHTWQLETQRSPSGR